MVPHNNLLRVESEAGGGYLDGMDLPPSGSEEEEEDDVDEDDNAARAPANDALGSGSSSGGDSYVAAQQRDRGGSAACSSDSRSIGDTAADLVQEEHANPSAVGGGEHDTPPSGLVHEKSMSSAETRPLVTSAGDARDIASKVERFNLAC